MLRLLAGTALALGAITSAHAVAINGTFAGALDVTTPAALLNVGSVLDINDGIATGTGTGDLSGVTFGTTITGVPTPWTVDNGQTFEFTLDGFGSFSGTTSGVLLTPGSTATNRTVRIFALGDFTPTIAGFDPGPASITGSFTQTGGEGSAVSFSFTFSSPPDEPPPPPPPTPSPATLALFGLGVAGLGLSRRR